MGDECCEACKVHGDPAFAPSPVPATPALTSARVRIEIVRGNESSFVELDGPEIVVGRSAGVHLPIADSVLARRQCRLFVAGDQLLLEDLDSACGTWLDDVAVRAPLPVRDGGVIFMGGTRLVVRAR